MTGGLIAIAATAAAICIVAVAQWIDRQAAGTRMQEWRERR